MAKQKTNSKSLSTKRTAGLRSRVAKPNTLTERLPFLRSRRNQIVAVVAFALVSAIILYQVFAGTVVGAIEAEVMTATSGSVAVAVKDSSSSANSYITFTNPATITGSFTTSAAGTSVVVRARTKPCDGGAIAGITLDGGTRQLVTVSATDQWADYTMPLSVAKGTHTISVTQTNSYTKKNADGTTNCVRTLSLDVIRVLDDTPSSTTTSVTLSPIADTYTSKINASTSYGASTTLRVDGVDGADSYAAYLKFDLSSLAGKSITKAQLQWNVTNSSTSKFDIRETISANWPETMTYTSRPPVSTNVITQTSGSNLTGIETTDITTYIAGKLGQQIGLAIDGAGDDGYAFDSKEAANKPKLIVTVAGSGSTADTTKPSVTLTSPASGSTLSGTVAIAATASDNVGVTKVEFTIDGALVATTSASPYSYLWDTTRATNAPHNIVAVAYDAAGNTQATNWTLVSVSNAAPSSQPTGNCAVAPPAGYTTLSLCDDFGTDGVLDARWTPSWFTTYGTYFSRAVNDREDNCYDSRNVYVAGGSLNLTTNKTTSPYCYDKSGKVVTSAGSLVSTYKKFDQAYGYFEARIYLPGTGGKIYNWPTFWTTGYEPPSWPANGEIDIVEINSDHIPNQHYHYGSNLSYDSVKNMDATGWHTYAAKWEPNKITWFIDGVQVAQTTTGVVSAPHYVIFDNKFNAYDTSSTLSHIYGQVMKVDYVRVWK